MLTDFLKLEYNTLILTAWAYLVKQGDKITLIYINLSDISPGYKYEIKSRTPSGIFSEILEKNSDYIEKCKQYQKAILENKSLI